MIASFVALERVKILSGEHLWPIIVALLFSIGVIRVAKKLSSERQKLLIHVMACLISIGVAAFHIHKYFSSTYDFTKDLPLYLCSLVALLMPIYTYFRSYWMFEILLFWIIAGTLQGSLTPDIAEGFPSLDYFRYWMVHLGLLFIMCYEITIFKRRPQFKSIFKSFGALQLYVVLMMLINYLLQANYFYLNKKPKSASLLDYFGDWPYYLIVTQLIVLPLFLLIYLPFRIKK